MSLSQNPYRSQNFMKQLLTTTKPRSQEEEQQRLEKMQKVATVANALSLMSDMAGLSMGADVMPTNDQVLPYTMNRIQEIKNTQMADEAAQRDAVIQNMYRAQEWQDRERRKEDDREYRSREAAKSRDFREEQAKKDREFYWDKYDKSREDEMKDFKEKEKIKHDLLIKRRYNSGSSKQDKEKVYFNVILDGKEYPMTERQIRSFYSKIQSIQRESEEGEIDELDAAVNKALQDDDLSLEDKANLIYDNWDAIKKYYTPPKGHEVRDVSQKQEKGKLNQTSFNNFIDSVMRGSYTDKGKRTAITDFLKDNGYNEGQINAFIKKLFPEK